MPRWALLASLAIGCGHPTAPARPGPGTPATADAAVDAPAVALEDDIPRLAQRATKLYGEWRTAFAEAGTDCAAAAARMNAIADANADVIEANRRVYRDRAKVEALREELAKYDAENEANAKAIIESPTMSRCASDPAFAQALDRLGGE